MYECSKREQSRVVLLRLSEFEMSSFNINELWVNKSHIQQSNYNSEWWNILLGMDFDTCLFQYYYLLHVFLCFFFGSICHKIDTHRLYHFSESSATQWLTTFIRETKTDVIWWLNRIGQRTRIQVRITTQQSQLDNVSLQWRHGDKLVIYNLTFDCVLFAFASLRYKDVN